MYYPIIGRDRMGYKKTVLKKQISVDDVVSVHYFEYTVDFSFSGELHDFWELIYADRNELVIDESDSVESQSAIGTS